MSDAKVGQVWRLNRTGDEMTIANVADGDVIWTDGWATPSCYLTASSRTWTLVWDAPSSGFLGLNRSTPTRLSSYLPVCDCGGAKARTTHAHWCSTGLWRK